MSAKQSCAGVTCIAAGNVSCCTCILNYCKTLKCQIGYRSINIGTWWRSSAFASVIVHLKTLLKLCNHLFKVMLRAIEQPCMCGAGNFVHQPMYQSMLY